MLGGLTFQVLVVSLVSAYYGPTQERIDALPMNIWVYTTTPSFTIECGLDYVPTPPNATYTWSRITRSGHDRITNDSLTQVFNATLRFLNFTADQEDQYMCQAEDVWPRYVKQYYWVFKLRIEPYSTNVGTDTIESPEYQYLKINCSFDGEVVGADIDYNWVELVENRYNQLSSHSDRVYPDLEGNLHFTPVLTEDEALGESSRVYSCFVASQTLKLGRYGRNILLNVSAGYMQPSAPVLKYKGIHRRAVRNDTSSLECVFFGYDPNSTTINRWYLPNDTLVPTGTWKYQLSYGGRRLTINDLQVSDIGVYHCESENGLGVSTRYPVRLLVCNQYKDPKRYAPLWHDSPPGPPIICDDC